VAHQVNDAGLDRGIGKSRRDRLWDPPCQQE
jgi:hypothetical protein